LIVDGTQWLSCNVRVVDNTFEIRLQTHCGGFHIPFSLSLFLSLSLSPPLREVSCHVVGCPMTRNKGQLQPTTPEEMKPPAQQLKFWVTILYKVLNN
jgi:hypothetical protein